MVFFVVFFDVLVVAVWLDFAKNENKLPCLKLLLVILVVLLVVVVPLPAAILFPPFCVAMID